MSIPVMSRFSATTLDLSRFPPPLAIRGVDYDGIIAARRARLVELMTLAGIPFDIERLDANPGMVLQQADGTWEMLTFTAINDTVRSIMVAFATGADLDHLALFYGVKRRIITPASGSTPAVLESDNEFRRRVLLAPESFAAAGPIGAYVFHALTADSRVLNVDVWSPAAGEVTIAVQSREGDGTASDELLASVRAYITRDSIKPLTDVVSIRSVTNHPFSILLDAYVQPGPDPVAVRTYIEQTILEMVADRRTPSRDMPRSAIIGAAQRAVVDNVTLVSPVTDIARGYGEVAVLEGLEVRVSEYAG
jgi:phage-related baseplate assembly protein